MTTLVDIDHDLVRELRKEVADKLSEHMQAVSLSDDDRQDLARALTLRALQQRATEDLSAGRQPRSAEVEAALVEAVIAALFLAGRLQPYLDDPYIENIAINGPDRVFVTFAGGRVVQMPPIAASEAELVALVQQLGADAGLSSRAFDTAHPELDVRLRDGSRLAATRDISPFVAVSIRKHRLHRVRIDDLVENGTLDNRLAAFLRALVAARANLMIAGDTDAGKTTLLRAAANEIPPHERLITIERTLELGLEQWPDLHPDVVPYEERQANSEGTGAMSMSQLVQRSLRMSPGRVIVGEVLGHEIIAMLNAMTQGNSGSLSTIHARSSEDVFLRVRTYALQAPERLDPEASASAFHAAIDFVVFIEKIRDKDGPERRVVTSIREITGVEGAQVQSTEVFGSPRTPRTRAVPRYPVSQRWIERLRDVGLDRASLIPGGEFS